jgi:hypothetical protein
MTKIKVDKEKLQVVFQCKNKGEMKWVLELYGKGAEQVGKEARASIGISDELKLFLVEVRASVYDNDQNFIVVADNEEEAKKIVSDEEQLITEDAEKINVEILAARKTKASKWKEALANGKGIIHEYNPHAGDLDLGI